MPSYKTCSVPLCKSTTIKTPDKLFITVPKRLESRNKWLQLARRDPTTTSTKSAIFFCEDHFDLPTDMDNYIEYKIMGTVKKIRIKPNCMPSHFHCQLDRSKRTAKTTLRSAKVNRQNKRTLQELTTDPVTEEPSTSRIKIQIEHNEDNVHWPHVKEDPPEHNDRSPHVKEDPPEYNITMQQIKVEPPEDNFRSPHVKEERPEDNVCSPPIKEEPPECNIRLHIKEEPLEDNACSPNVKQEPPEYNIRLPHVKEEPSEDKIRLPGAATAVKVEIDIEPTVFQPIDTHYKLLPDKGEPVADQPSGNNSSEDLLTNHVIGNQPSESSPTTSNFKHTKLYCCDVCSSSFSIKGSLSRHMLIHIKKKPHICEVCNKCFTLKTHLSQHMLIHTEQNQYSCKICSKCFSIKRNLLRHMSSHAKQNQYCCKICSKGFSIKGNLSRHMLIHTKQKAHCCEVCSKSFTLQHHLSEHIMYVHNKHKPHCCDVCRKCFARKNGLSKHQLIHNKQRMQTQ